MKPETLALIDRSNLLLAHRDELRKKKKEVLALSQPVLGKNSTKEGNESQRAYFDAFVEIGQQITRVEAELDTVFSKAIQAVVNEAGLKMPSEFDKVPL